jgi:DNA-binding XRE family transcriptional regulator/SOS-response transcriptional repressor LexA
MNAGDVKKLRRNLGFTQKELAQKIGVSLKTITNYESGGVIPVVKQRLLESLTKASDGIKERLQKLLEEEGLNPNQFYVKTGLANGFLNTVGETLRKPSIEKIQKAFPRWNIAYIIEGTGNMYAPPRPLKGPSLDLKNFGIGGNEVKVAPCNDIDMSEEHGETIRSLLVDTLYTEPSTTVPLLPIAARGGTLNDFVMSVKSVDCEKIISPITGIDFAITVTGDSMAPEYPHGSRILIKKINEKAFIDWGRVYVLDTCNGTVIKKIMPGSKEDRVQCQSLNEAYPPFEICFNDMFGMYRVLMLLAEK